jgi:cytochrome c
VRAANPSLAGVNSRSKTPAALKLQVRRLPLLLILSAMTLSGCAPKPPGTKEEAKAMVIRAADYLKQVGPEKAFPAFNTGRQWHDRDLYVFVFDRNRVLKSSGAFQKSIGEHRIDVPDVEHHLWVKRILSIKDQGWVNYRYWSPIDITKTHKSSYCIHVGDYFVGVGVYNYQLSNNVPVAKGTF